MSNIFGVSHISSTCFTAKIILACCTKKTRDNWSIAYLLHSFSSVFFLSSKFIFFPHKLNDIVSLLPKRALLSSFPASIYMFKVSNKNTSTRWKICSKLTVKTPELWAGRCWDSTIWPILCSSWPIRSELLRVLAIIIVTIIIIITIIMIIIIIIIILIITIIIVRRVSFV